MQNHLDGFIKTQCFEYPFAGASTIREIFPLLINILSPYFKGAIVTTMLYDEHTQSLKPGPGFEMLPLEICSAMECLPLGSGACGVAIRDRQVVIIQDMEACEPPPLFSSQCKSAGLRSLWSVPIFFDEYIFGTICIFHMHPYIPSKNEIQKASSFAISAASALIVTKLKEQKNELTKSKNNFIEAQKIAQLGTWEWDPDEEKSIWSAETFRIFGLEPRPDGVITHAEVFSYIYQDDVETLKHAIYRAKQGMPYEIEIRIIRTDGEERVLRSRKNQSVIGHVVMGTVQDITERKISEQQLLESREQYRSLIDYNSDGICSFDLNGQFTEANLAFRKLIGYSIYELSKMSYTDIIFDEDHNKMRPYAEQAIHINYRKNLDCTLKHKDGSPIFVRYTNIPMMINRKLVGIYALIKDVSLEKRAEEMLRRSEKLSVVGQLAAGFAHEIRNPLTSLKGFLQLLESTHKTDNHARHIQIMLDEIEHIENITSELLILAKPQADKVILSNLVAIVQTVIQLFEPQALLKGIEIAYNLIDKPLMIRCVPSQIKQVFINLIKNALEAMPNGGTVFVQAKRDLNNHACISIRDEGIGIPKESLTQIFEPFYTTKVNGTGLGLIVTHNIIEHHEGNLDIVSEPGNGTKITVTLPLAVY